MIKNIMLMIAVGISVLSAKSQDKQEGGLANLFKFEAGVHGIGFGKESKLGDSYALDLSAGVGGGYRITSSGFDYRWSVQNASFFIKSQLKFHYNRARRIQKKRTTLNNSGNYFGLLLKYASSGTDQSSQVPQSSIAINNVLMANVHWGAQRTLGKRFIVATYIGLLYAKDLDTKQDQFLPAFGLKSSYILFH